MANNNVKVFGHLAPDTDTTCSAILWAWYLNNYSTQKATPYVLGPLNKETIFVLNQWHVPVPELLESIKDGEEVIVVDTNNPQELFPNIGEANILQIIDHHKLSGLSTKSPLSVTLKTYASTATIINDLIGSTPLPKEMAGLMLSCVLSDTLAFRSPTTTPHDKDLAEKLAKSLGINIVEYSDEMFKAKSDVSDFTDQGLINIDSKKYPVGGKNIRVSVLETTAPELILKRKSGIISAIKETVKEEKDVDDVLLFVIDILREEATVFTYSKLTKDIVSASFGVSVEGDTEVLPGILSRKKQILPVLKLP